MMKKVLVALLAVVVVVLVADLVYIGSVLFFPKTTQPVTNNYDTENMVSIPSLYVPPMTTQSGMQTVNPYPTQAVVQQQTPQMTNPANPTDSVQPTAVQENSGIVSEYETDAPVAQQPATYTLEQTIAAMESAVAYLKNAQNFTGVKTQIPTIRIVELSLSTLKGPAQAIVDRFAETTSVTYVFTNGYAVDPETNETVTPAQAIPPDSKQFRIAPESVTGYNVTTDSAGNTTYTVAIMEESCTLAAPVPYYHSMCMDYVDLNDYDISPAKFNSGDIYYHEATVSVTVNSAGIPIALREYMPVSGRGEGTLLVTATGELTGSLDEQWTFSW